MNYRKNNNYEKKLEFDKSIIFESDDPAKFINYVEEQKDLSKNTKRQLRKFYDNICDIKELDEEIKVKSKVANLIISLKYAKNRRVIDEKFAEKTMSLLDYLMKNPKKENYEKFRRFFEALIAYYGGE